MFRNLSRRATSNEAVLEAHPLQLSRFLEEAWTTASQIPGLGGITGQPFLGSTTIVTDLALPPSLAATLGSGINSILISPGITPSTVLAWDQLIYAFLIESTGALEIFAEVLRRLATGETLEELSTGSARWARTTEELFFRDASLFAAHSVTSQLRADQRIARRNAYWRMFGLDLSHPLPPRWSSGGGVESSWKTDTGAGVNAAFREKWAELLRQLWLGIENKKNTSGANATDSEYVAFLCKALSDMMQMRRRGGQLAREEFAYVSTMSWFHLTVETDSPIVVSLKATATSPADRLAKIAERVGMAPAPRSRELFELAEPMSALMRAIELGFFNIGTNAEQMFDPARGNPQLIEDVNRVIDLWQSATGERVKDRPAGNIAATLSAQPIRIPSTTSVRTPVPALNGHRG